MMNPAFAGLVMSALLLWPEVLRAQGRETGPKLGAAEYEGWRQYSANCARCHGQDVAGNPVAANLRKSAATGGPVADEAAFVQVTKEGRPKGGMPGFAKQLTDEQIKDIYAYVKGRADGKIPEGRPQKVARSG
jgi:mono/diheme cytochrome c family protein